MQNLNQIGVRMLWQDESTEEIVMMREQSIVANEDRPTGAKIVVLLIALFVPIMLLLEKLFPFANR